MRNGSGHLWKHYSKPQLGQDISGQCSLYQVAWATQIKREFNFSIEQLVVIGQRKKQGQVFTGIDE